jgi:hypothetical protein
LGEGFWKTHPEAWPVTSLTLGGKTYSEAQVLTILGIPVRGDASLILADQLSAALLNMANGTSSVPVSATTTDAQRLLFGVNLLNPPGVRSSSSSGKKMLNAAEALEAYNSGALLTPNCSPSVR